MAFSILSHLLLVERHRQRIARSPTVAGFATPALGEIQLGDQEEPALIASNMRGEFRLTRKSRENVARYGFTPCSVDEEPALVTELARWLWNVGPGQGWNIRCTSVPEAVESFRRQGLEARTIVVSSQLARGVLGQEALPPEGFAGIVDRKQVLVTSLPESVAIVALAPVTAGYCSRVGDNVGMLVRPLAFRVVNT
jgi:hypothetical protein